jgi:hypothetical protein
MAATPLPHGHGIEQKVPYRDREVAGCAVLLTTAKTFVNRGLERPKLAEVFLYAAQ